MVGDMVMVGVRGERVYRWEERVTLIVCTVLTGILEIAMLENI